MIDYGELARELRKMKPRQRLYELVKAEMKARGRWKPAPKGKPFQKGYDERRKPL